MSWRRGSSCRFVAALEPLSTTAVPNLKVPNVRELPSEKPREQFLHGRAYKQEKAHQDVDTSEY